ncbi:MAG: type II 3-dehydroquinate dehydratase [Armatimonadetes bacterium]|nr:type II 3-dehydroquinate dehydratase [Armatimonadota bacterium]
MSKLSALVLNGPNLNLLGVREPGLYGSVTYQGLVELVQGWAEELGIEVECFQSNHEGALLDRIHEARGRHRFLVFNPGAYTHTSIALRDALAGTAVPCLEVHLTNIYAREEFRRHSMVSPVCAGVIGGLGVLGYRLALEAGVQLFGAAE